MLGLGKKSIGVDFSVIVEATPKRIKHKSLVSDLWNIITLQQMSFNLSAFFLVFFFYNVDMYDANHKLVHPTRVTLNF